MEDMKRSEYRVVIEDMQSTSSETEDMLHIECIWRIGSVARVREVDEVHTVFMCCFERIQVQFSVHAEHISSAERAHRQHV